MRKCGVQNGKMWSATFDILYSLTFDKQISSDYQHRHSDTLKNALIFFSAGALQSVPDPSGRSHATTLPQSPMLPNRLGSV